MLVRKNFTRIINTIFLKQLAGDKDLSLTVAYLLRESYYVRIFIFFKSIATLNFQYYYDVLLQEVVKHLGATKQASDGLSNQVPIFELSFKV